MTEETIIRVHDSGRRPFATPEGYFEGFTERLMQKLPERPTAAPAPHVARQAALTPMRRWLRYAAAIAVVAGCVGGGLLLMRPAPDAAAVAAISDDMLTDDNIDEMLDYEMVSNNQIAYYLTEAY